MLSLASLFLFIHQLIHKQIDLVYIVDVSIITHIDSHSPILSYLNDELAAEFAILCEFITT